MISTTNLLLGLALLQPALGFVASPMHRYPSLSSTLLRDSQDDSSEAAVNLSFSASDLARMASIKSRHVTMPLLIMDSIVPGQTMFFESDDPKFHNLIRHSLQEGTEVGMIGLNPHTGRPLTHGVTLPIKVENVVLDTRKNVLSVKVQAERRIEVQGEPWLHDEAGEMDRQSASFYMADLEIVDDRPEEPLADDLATNTQNLSDQVPLLVGSWVHHLVAKNRADALKMEERMMELGPLPSDWKDQAFWVAALLNPCSSHQASEEKVCLEIRPAMLSCKNDHERMILATAGLQASIDHISGERELF
jgi:hypothetical protein